jgi:hypothetical protein
MTNKYTIARDPPIMIADCGNSKRYVGKRKPTCGDGTGCQECWVIYFARLGKRIERQELYKEQARKYIEETFEAE